MKTNRISLALALGSALLLATAVHAERRWFLSGELDMTDRVASTVIVEGRTLTILPTSLIKNQDGTQGNWDDIEGREGDYVSVLASTGTPHPVVETIVLADEEEDGD